MRIIDKVVWRQAIKTAMATSIAAAFYLYLKMPDGYWAVIVAAMVMQSNMETGSVRRTLMQGVYRILGTLFGAIIGLLCLTVVYNDIWLAVPIGFIIVFTSIYYLEPKTGLKMIAPTALIVMLVSAHYHEPWDLALYRFLAIVLGCTIAVVVTVLFMPYRSEFLFRSALAEHIGEQKHIFNSLLALYKEKNDKSSLNEMQQIIRLNADIERSRLIMSEIVATFAGNNKSAKLQNLFYQVQTLAMYLRNMNESEYEMHGDLYCAEMVDLLEDIAARYNVVFDRVIKLLRGQKLGLDKINFSREQLLSGINMHRQNRIAAAENIASLDASYYLLSFYHSVVHIGDVLLAMQESAVV